MKSNKETHESIYILMLLTIKNKIAKNDFLKIRCNANKFYQRMKLKCIVDRRIVNFLEVNPMKP